MGDNDDHEYMDGWPSKKRALPLKHEQATGSMIQNVLAQEDTILKDFADAAQECKVVTSNLKKTTDFLARLEVAKDLGGDREELKKIMDEARAMDDSNDE